MNKLKKITAVCLTCIMVLGMTLTANAAHSYHNWKSIPVSIYCKSCGSYSAIMECTMEYPSIHRGCYQGHPL